MLRQAERPFEGMNRAPGELRKEHWPCRVVILLAQQGRSEREGLSVQGTGCGKMVPDKWDVFNRLF